MEKLSVGVRMAARMRGYHAFALMRLVRKLPLLEQLRGDPLALGRAARSKRSEELEPRTKSADRVVQSICPYCAVGCGQRIYVRDERVIQIEGDPDSPISRGRLCPKGSASKSLVTHPNRLTKMRYRRPGGRAWEDLDLDTAMDMIAQRIVDTREDTWESADDEGTQHEASGAAVEGNQRTQSLTVTYTDGSKETLFQHFSDWFQPQSFPGETRALRMPYRNMADGTKDGRPFTVYHYGFRLNGGKTVKSLTLPNNPNVRILAVTLANESTGRSCTKTRPAAPTSPPIAKERSLDRRPSPSMRRS